MTKATQHRRTQPIPDDHPHAATGRAIQRARIAAGFENVKEVARALGKHVSTIKAWETGRFPVGCDSLMVLADLFGVSIDELVGHERSPSRNWFIDTARERRIRDGDADATDYLLVCTAATPDTVIVSETAARRRITNLWKTLPSQRWANAAIRKALTWSKAHDR